DIDGLYSSDPRVDGNAKLISSVHEITDEIRSLAGGAGTPLGTGGMETKIRAAETVTSHGCDLVIANGGKPSVLYDIAAGKPAGTRFFAKRNG
ncbi:MAG: glutamate 5-kinase, partial [Clostridia bacterium]|nr:glutamate 5-kinase [Clostridia bacterium]